MTNEQAIGYMIIAARRLHITAEIEAKLDRAMSSAMDEYTEEEAEDAYRRAGEQA